MTKYTVDTHALPYPEGVDRVAVAADLQALATKTAGAITAEGARAESAARWGSLSSLSTTASLDKPQPPGQISVASAANPGLPVSRIGSLTSEKVSAASLLTYKTWGPEPRLFIRSFAVDGTPYAWKEFAGVPEVTALAGRVTAVEGAIPRGPTRTLAGTKVVPLAVTAPGTTVTQTMPAGAARWVRRWAVAPSRVRVHIANRNPANQANGSAVTLQGVHLGKGSQGGGVSGQVVTLPGGPLPANGAEFVTPWTALGITDGDYLALTIAWSGASDASVQMMQGGGWTSTNAAAATDGSVSGWTRSQATPFHVWVEAEVPTSTPVVLANGDSISIGTATEDPVGDAWPAIYALKHGALPVLMGQHGSSLANWTASSHRWNLYGGLEVGVVDAVIVCLGQNDLAVAGVTTEVLRARYAEVRAALSRYPAPIYVGALTPSTKDAPVEVVRREFNAWLKGLPSGERGYFDFATAVGDASDENLNPALSADGLHPNRAGQEAMSALIEAAPVTPFTLSPRQLKALAGA